MLASAEALVAERGLAFTLNDVAQHAGLGVATTYRQFANKDELIDELFLRRLDQAVGIAHDALADPDPWRGLTAYFDRSLGLELSDRGMTQMIEHIRRGPRADRVHEWRDQLVPPLTELMDRARSAGVLRSDVVTADGIVLQSALTTIVDMSRRTEPWLYRRYLTLLLDGLRADPHGVTALSVGAPDVDQASAEVVAVHWSPEKSKR